jgi:paraquat-inducible protein A
LLLCRACRLVSRSPGAGGGPSRRGPGPAFRIRCPRCGDLLLPRKRDSVERTWAFLIAAAALYIPANTLPIMQTSSLFGYQRDTILSGILFLWSSGSWPLAAVVFIASFLVPLGKLLSLAFLLVSVQRGWRWARRERTVLYRIVEIIGRWSMLDIFVMTLLVALVQVRALAQIRAEPGAIAFGAVVVLTMLAAFSFDPRLIWDAKDAGRRSLG